MPADTRAARVTEMVGETLVLLWGGFKLRGCVGGGKQLQGSRGMFCQAECGVPTRQFLEESSQGNSPGYLGI